MGVTGHRVLQWIGIVLILGLFAGAYWYFKVRASTLNAPQNDSLTSGLVGLWSFNGDDVSGTTAYDRSVSGNNGTLTNGPSRVDGKIGQALNFDGTDDYVSVPSTGTNFERTDTLSFSAWVKWNDVVPVGGYSTFFGRTGGTNRGTFFSECKNAYASFCNANSIAFSLVNNWTVNGIMVSTATNSVAPNIWTHVTVTYNGNSNTSGVHIYINGVDMPLTTFVNNLSATIIPSNPNWRIGDDYTNDWFSGRIDEFRVYNRTLSAGEVQSLYNLGGGTKIDTSISQSQGTGRLDSGLAGYWPLDNGSGTSATDSSTNGNTGTLTNGPTWTAGQISGGVDFDGTDDYVTIPDADTIDVTDSTNFTLSGWFNRDTFTTDDTILAKSNGQTAADTGYTVYIDDATDKVTFVANDGTDQYKLESASTFTATGWHHYAIVWNDSGSGLTKLFIDGVSEIATATGTFANVNSLANALTLRLGTESDTGNPFDGKLDEARIYNRTLSGDEVSQFYRLTSPTGVDTGLKGYWSFNSNDMNGTAAYDRSGAGNSGTLTNGPVPSEGKIGQGLSFDGTDDYVNVGDSTAFEPAQNITMTAWIYPTGNGSYPGIITKSASTGESLCKYALYLYGTTRRLSFSMGGSAVQSVNLVAPLNTWSFVSVTQDGSGLTLYLNGSSETFSTRSAPSYSTETLKIGTWTGTGQMFPGKIDEARIYSRALSVGEIRSLYDAGADGKVNSSVSQNQGTGRLDSGLAGYWPLDNGSGTSATDTSTNGNTGTLTNGPTWGTGQIGGDVVFDGTNDYISAGAGSSSSLNITSDSFAISAWVYPTGIPALNQALYSSSIFDRWDHGCTGYGYAFGFTNSITFNAPTDLILQSNCGSGGGGKSGASGVLVNNSWQHVVATVDAGRVTFYVNNVAYDGGSGFVAPLSYSGSAIIGNRSAGTAPFAGSIDEVRVYNRPLSASEVSQLYRLTTPTGVDTSLKGYWSFNGKDMNGTTAYDRSGMGNNGTLTNGPARSEGKIGQGLSFDGSNDYVNVPYANLNFERTDPFTLSVWVKRNVTGAYPSFLGKTNGTATGIYFGVCSTAIANFCNAESAALMMVGGSAGEALNMSTATSSLSATMPVGVWTHVVATYDGSSGSSGVKIYINGTNMMLTTQRNNLASTIKVSVNWRIGDDYTNDWWNGSMDEVRIYNRVLSATEVASLYNSSR